MFIIDSNNILLKIGKKIYELRKEADLKQIDVSKQIGIPQSSYSEIENGHYNITIRQLVKICEFYKVDISYIFNENDGFTEKELIELADFKKYIISKRRN